MPPDANPFPDFDASARRLLGALGLTVRYAAVSLVGGAFVVTLLLPIKEPTLSSWEGRAVSFRRI